MAKPQRKSINDALAEIAAQAPSPEASHGARDHVERDHATKEDPPRAALPARIDIARDHVGHGHATTHHTSADTDADGYRVRVRREKPHVSLYAHPRVFAVIRDLANAQRRKPHDLYAEGLRLMLAQYGYDFDELDGRPGRG